MTKECTADRRRDRYIESKKGTSYDASSEGGT